MIPEGHIGTVHLRSPKIDAIRATFEKNARRLDRAYIAPPVNGWTTFYPRDPDSAREWAERLSKDLKTDVVAVQIIEDEVLSYQFFAKGNLVDEYANKPAYFLGQSEDVSQKRIQELRGKAETWEPFLTAGKEVDDVRQLLQGAFSDPSGEGTCGDYLIPETLCEELCTLVGIVGATTSYEDINDEIEEWEEEEEMRDEDDEEEPEDGIISCGRHAREMEHIRAQKPAAQNPAVK